MHFSSILPKALSPFSKVLYISAALAIALSAWFDLALPAMSDKGWLLHSARVWLTGGKLYIDIVEINPPLILWLYAIPVWFSIHVKGLTDSAALGGIGLVCCAFSVAVGMLVIRLHPALRDDVSRRWIFGLLLTLIFIFYTPQAYFFDRDHIFIVFTFPYILRFMPSLCQKHASFGLKMTTGCMAALGFCIKPHTIIVFAALQLFIVIQRRSINALLNLENVIIVVAALAYGVCVALIAPEYFQFILPLARATYSDFGNFNSRTVYLPLFFMALFIMFADFRVWHQTPYRRDIYYFIGTSLACVVYALFNNGWGYTYNPLYSMLMLICGWMIWDYSWLEREFAEQGISTRRVKLGKRGCVVVMCAHAVYMLVYIFIIAFSIPKEYAPCRENKECQNPMPLVRFVHDRHIHSFGTISFDFSKWVIVTDASGAAWVTRFNHLWMMSRMLCDPGFRATHHWITEYVALGLADDLNRKHPDMMIVDSSAGIMGHKIDSDFPAVLSGIPEFKKAWQQYRYITTFDFCSPGDPLPSECRYDVYFYSHVF